MIRPDVVLCWPKHIDFPLFRYKLNRLRGYFNQVLIGLVDNGMPEDYTNFLVNDIRASFKTLPRAHGGKDWRNEAVNTLLEKSHAEYVLFLEQDFLIRDERFFEVLLNIFNYDFVYYEEGERIHPACILVKRSIINKTQMDFTARPPAYDHFGLFTKEALAFSSACDLEEIGLHNRIDYLHLQGLTQNYHATPFHKEKEFLTYNKLCLDLPVAFNDFKNKMIKIEQENICGILDEDVTQMFPLKEVA